MRVHRLVRRVLDGVDPGECAGLVREIADGASVHDCSDGIGGPREGHDPRARTQLALQIGEVQGGVRVHVGVPDLQLQVTGQVEPGRDVAVVVQPGDDNLVARLQLPA